MFAKRWLTVVANSIGVDVLADGRYVANQQTSHLEMIFFGTSAFGIRVTRPIRDELTGNVRGSGVVLGDVHVTARREKSE